jgi:Asp/Glu/hydantoin racemase
MKTFKRLAILNPNTNKATTELMVNIAQALVPNNIKVEGHTMLLGPKVVTDEAELAASARQIIQIGSALASDGVDAILIAGFGDPGLSELIDCVNIPVTGIAEAGMAAAALMGTFSIVTTTPDLRRSIESMVKKYGHAEHFKALHITPGSVEATMASQQTMQEALVSVALKCAREGAQSVLIGGGPLAAASRAVAESIPLPVVEPVAAGVRLSLSRLGLAAHD